MNFIIYLPIQIQFFIHHFTPGTWLLTKMNTIQLNIFSTSSSRFVKWKAGTKFKLKIGLLKFQNNEQFYSLYPVCLLITISASVSPKTFKTKLHLWRIFLKFCSCNFGFWFWPHYLLQHPRKPRKQHLRNKKLIVNNCHLEFSIWSLWRLQHPQKAWKRHL